MVEIVRIKSYDLFTSCTATDFVIITTSQNRNKNLVELSSLIESSDDFLTSIM